MSEITYTIKEKSNRPEYRELAITKDVFMDLMMLKYELKMTNSELIKFLIRYYREHEI